MESAARNAVQGGDRGAAASHRGQGPRSAGVASGSGNLTPRVSASHDAGRASNARGLQRPKRLLRNLQQKLQVHSCSFGVRKGLLSKAHSVNHKKTYIRSE